MKKERICKNCFNRQKFGYCCKKDTFVPKKKGTDGTNPARNCKWFNKN